jgi:serine/threonine protein kinase
MTSDVPLPHDPQSRLPRKFGRYALFDFIGKGGMAEIFLARAHTELGASRLCVVKQILPEYATHPQFAEMLIHEAKLAARLSHTHIVQVFDLGREGDQLYIAMEYVEGFDLNALLRRCTQRRIPLPLEFALLIVTDTLKGLDYAHRRTSDEGKPLGIVHRDVSPSNVLVSLEGEVKVCDFGIARANDAVLSEGGDMDEAIKGKAGYMSPEHARGEPLDARADVFACGIVLWELLAGKRMYKKDGDVPLLEQAKRALVPELPSKGLPHEENLHALVNKALAPDRNSRYPSAGAMLREIERFLSEVNLVASPLKLGEWLVQNFGAELLEQRRARERMTPIPAPSVPVPRHSTPAVPAVAAANPSGSSPTASIAPAASDAPAAHSISSPPAISRPPSGPSTLSQAPISGGTGGPVSPRAKTVEDPPSLPAATVDVVPSSAMRQSDPAEGPSARKKLVGIAVVGVLMVLALILGVLYGSHR